MNKLINTLMGSYFICPTVDNDSLNTRLVFLWVAESLTRLSFVILGRQPYFCQIETEFG